MQKLQSTGVLQGQAISFEVPDSYWAAIRFLSSGRYTINGDEWVVIDKDGWMVSSSTGTGEIVIVTPDEGGSFQVIYMEAAV